MESVYLPESLRYVTPHHIYDLKTSIMTRIGVIVNKSAVDCCGTITALGALSVGWTAFLCNPTLVCARIL
jgi:hypothetical protein